jgi:hypothetical protein
LLAYAAANAADLREMLAVTPHGYPLIYQIGMRNVPEVLGGKLGWPPALVTLAALAMLIPAMLLAARQAGGLRAASGALTPAETYGLLIGACLIVGCFVAGQRGHPRLIAQVFHANLLSRL